jgi:hypothetical protein
MQSTLTLKRHAALVDRMANSLGVDLEQKIIEGQMQFDALGDMILACTGCAAPDRCDHWLEQNRHETAEAAPEYCRNGGLFALLKDGKKV